MLIWNCSCSKNKGIKLLGLFMSVCSLYLLLFMSSSCSVFPSPVGRVAVLCSGHGIVQSLPKGPFYNSVPWTGVLTVRTYLRTSVSFTYRSLHYISVVLSKRILATFRSIQGLPPGDCLSPLGPQIRPRLR